MAALSAAALVTVAACGSSSASGGSPSGSKQPANVAAAKSAVAGYTVAPTDFPVSERLPHRLPAGKKFVYLQCSTPICAAVGTFVKQAALAAGGTFTAVNAGSTAQTAQAAASSADALKPDAVILGAIDPALFGGGLKKLAGNGAKLVSLQIHKDVRPYGITFNYLGPELSQRNGKLLADWVIARRGAQADTVLYTLPALDISAPMQDAFKEEMTANCPSCKVRVVPIDVATIGTTAPRTIVTDLQAHKSTNTAVFVSLSAAGGLPAALKAAGLSVTTVGFGPTAGNLQDIKDGSLTAALNIDFPVSTWTAVDAAVRLIEGAQPTDNEKVGAVPEQFLEQKDVTFDPTRGWTAFPDYAQRFARLWQVS
ncbi:substrate-binding domain-containing protein [Streptomyces sp. V4-01]|uniref:Substrate-binding domain-containing protein n=1 Tax=Actinacidiphila polyblastidii TaxID=3110430 RepID=A0ABU7PJ89_9ACTN|nr:substrate-binding domain-containing protein [Streptomyces sp. V4-01]